MEGKQLTVREPMALTPAEVVENATTQSRLLMDIVEKTQCYQNISGKKYLQVEAWETIGAFNRVNAIPERVTPITRDNEIVGYEAEVGLYKDGMKVGGAIMPAFFSENCCKGKEGDAKHKASMSAAQTFATSKAYRMNFSYVAILAGYQPLPFEEVIEDMHQLEPKQKEHWCEKHNTSWFKTPKMKAYAHPVKARDGSQAVDENGKPVWCSEPATQPPKSKSSPVSETVNGNPPVEPEEAPETPAYGKMPRPDRDPDTIKTLLEAQKACHSDFGMQPAQFLKELNVGHISDISDTAPECYRRIMATRCD